MTSVLPRVLTLALAVPLVSGFATGSSAQHVAAVALCSPAMRPIDARTQCFPPSGAGRAEREMPVPVVPPMALVRRLSRLRLSQISIERGAAGVAAINYLFGRIPVDPKAPPALGVPLYNAPRPLYVLVREFVGHTRANKPRLFQSYSAMGHGAWHFVANFGDRNLALSIAANESKRTTQRIGRALIDSS